jgi:hypothetical protein
MSTTQNTKHLIVSLVVLAAFVTVLWWTYALDAKGALVPRLVCWTGIVLSLLDVVAHTSTGFGRRVAMAMSGTAHLEVEKRGAPLAREVVASLWMVGATALAVLAGFLPAIPVYVVGYMVIHGRKSLRTSVITAAVTTAVIWFTFEVLMEYQLYRGIFFEL